MAAEPAGEPNSGCGVIFLPSPAGHSFLKDNESRRDEERMDSKEKKMQMGFLSVG